VPVAFAWTVAGKNLCWVDGIKHVMAGRTQSGVSAETSSRSPTVAAPQGSAESTWSYDAANGRATVASTPALESGRSTGSGTHIYRCLDASGQSIYSDQSCGGVVEVRRYDSATVNTYSPPPSAATTAGSRGAPSYSSPQTIRRSTSSTAAQAHEASGRPQVCDWIRDELEAIDARMRHRYTSYQGSAFASRFDH
jgi:hypothetical protein